MPDTAQAINEIYQDQKTPVTSPSGTDPGENGAQRPLNPISPKTEQQSSSDAGTSSTESSEKGKRP